MDYSMTEPQVGRITNFQQNLVPAENLFDFQQQLYIPGTEHAFSEYEPLVLSQTHPSAVPTTSTFFSNAPMTSAVPKYPAAPTTAFWVPRYENPACDSTSAFATYSETQGIPINQQFGSSQSSRAAVGFFQCEMMDNSFSSTTEREAMNTNHADATTSTDETPSTYYTADLPTTYIMLPKHHLDSTFAAVPAAQGYPTNQRFGSSQSKEVVENSFDTSIEATITNHSTASKAADVTPKYYPSALTYPSTLTTPVPSTAQFNSPQSTSAIGVAQELIKNSFDSPIEGFKTIDCITIDESTEEDEDEEKLLVVDEYPPVNPTDATEKSVSIEKYVGNSKMHTHTNTHMHTAPVFSRRRKMIYESMDYEKEILTYHCKSCGFHAKNRASFSSHKCITQNGQNSRDQNPQDQNQRAQSRRERKAEWKCDLCQFSAVNNATLVQHKKLHNRDKPFQCNKCVFSVNWRASLTKHYGNHHRDHLSTNLTE